jgi:hypothetical protein
MEQFLNGTIFKLNNFLMEQFSNWTNLNLNKFKIEQFWIWTILNMNNFLESKQNFKIWKKFESRNSDL